MSRLHLDLSGSLTCCCSVPLVCLVSLLSWSSRLFLDAFLLLTGAFAGFLSTCFARGASFIDGFRFRLVRDVALVYT